MRNKTYQPSSALLPERMVPHEAHEKHLDVLAGPVCVAVAIVP